MRYYFLVALSIIFLSACTNTEQSSAPQQSDSKPKSDAPAQSDNRSESDTSQQPAAVSVSVKNSAEFKELVENRKGKFVVVDLWALW